MINDPNRGSYSERPRGLAYANGERLEGVIGFAVDNNAFFQADSFSLTLSLSAQAPSRNWDWWSVQEKLEVELLVGLPEDPDNFGREELTSYILGYVDDIDFDPVGDTITMVGRDLTSELIDYRRAISFVGELTAAEVVRQIAVERGLEPVVTATQKQVGTYYQIFHKLISSDSTYWDIVCRLAQLEQYQVYVSGRKLHFEPRTPADADPYVLEWQPPSDDSGSPRLNACYMTFKRNLSIAKDLKVRVLSFDQKKKQNVDVTAVRTRVYNKSNSRSTRFEGPPQEYVYSLPNLTSDQALRRAQAMLKELSMHEVNLHAEMPADDLLNPRRIVKAQGTGTAFDQNYYPSSISRRYEENQGFRMTLHAKNQTPNTPN